MTTLLKTRHVQKPNSCNYLIKYFFLVLQNKLPNIFKVACESRQFRNPEFFPVFNNTTISHSSTNMRNHSGFLMANLTQVSLPVQDLYRMMVEHDGYDMSRTLRRHIDLVVFGIEKHIFKVILYSCWINIVTLHCIEHIDVRCSAE